MQKSVDAVAPGARPAQNRLRAALSSIGVTPLGLAIIAPVSFTLAIVGLLEERPTLPLFL